MGAKCVFDETLAERLRRSGKTDAEIAKYVNATEAIIRLWRKANLKENSYEIARRRRLRKVNKLIDDGLSTSEIAAVMKVTPGAVRKWKAEARKDTSADTQPYNRRRKPRTDDDRLTQEFFDLADRKAMAWRTKSNGGDVEAVMQACNVSFQEASELWLSMPEWWPYYYHD